MARKLKSDRVLFIATLLLVGLSIVMVYSASAVVAIGEARPLLRDALGDAVEVREAASLEEAVDDAFALARPSGVVLLAPACASFDMFRDYAERGRRFKEAVARIARAFDRP